ncbi:MAG: heat-inducible transcriptional repressor HrcA [Candidatus Omnitrophota bacterium]
MKQVDIESRRRGILAAIVESYIGTATPVGSRVISQRLRGGLSPATIRNVMVDLEEMGLIMQPHTSAGRVPTDKGYRTYVDSLLEPIRLTKDEESLILKLVDQSGQDLDSIIQGASRAISVITNVAGVALTPRLKKSVFEHIEIIPIDSSRFLAVLVTSSGLVKNAMLDSGEEMAGSELARVAEFLNQELNGMSLGDIKHYLARRLLQERDSFYAFLKKAIDIVSLPNLSRMEDHLYCEGLTCMMANPEFKDMSKARLLLRLLEEKKDLFNLLYEDMESEGIKVHIGRENAIKDIQDCSLITCNYKVNGVSIGAIAAVGPTRMEYGKVMATVRYMSEVLGKVLERLG